MRTLAISLILMAATAAAQAPAPSVARVFTLTHNEPVQDMQEMATAIRTIADIKDLTTDTTQKTITLKGTAAQVELADWLFNELDKPANRLPLAQRAPEQVAHEFVAAGEDKDSKGRETKENFVRVVYLPQTETIQDFQEVATMTRTIAEIRRVFTYNAPRALILRGTSTQIAMGTWVIGEIDAQVAQRGASKREFQVPAADQTQGDGVVRVLLAPNTKTIQDFQEMATLLRTTAQIRRVFTYNKPRAIAVRGTAEQMALAEWLMSNLNAAPSPAKRQYMVGGNPTDVVSLFYLSPSLSVQDFQKDVTQIRNDTKIKIAFTYNAPRALAVRGSMDQIQQAELMVQGLAAR